MEWLRWYHGAVSDDKWPLIARKSGQNVAVVIAVWAALLECASQADGRGSIDGFDAESIDALLQLDDGATQSVIDALSSGKRPRIVDGHIVNWTKRQPVREDGSAERSREWRERKKQEKAACSENMNAERTPCERTANAEQTQTNTDKRREEKKRINTSPPVDILVNEDSARDNGHSTGGILPIVEQAGEGTQTADAGGIDLSEPGMEFVELRDFYTRKVKPEGPLDGFAEYKQLKAARDRTGHSVYPGNGRLVDDIAARMSAGAWNPGYEIGLSRYLKTRTWLAPMPNPRASPDESAEREKAAREGAARRARLAAAAQGVQV